MSVDGFTLLAEAHEYLLTVVRGVPAGAWGAPTPCSEWTVRQVLNHARLDQQALVMQITEEAPTGDPFDPADAPADGGGDAVAELAAVLDRAAKAWESVRDAESVPTPMGPMPAAAGAAVAALDAAVHAWDIARATGQDVPLTDSLAEGLESPAAQIVDFVRNTFGKFGPAVEVPADAGRAAQLLGFTGRDPQWAPSVA
ncbi:TIGR03086 family metal-binding protein [Kitasatospora purpeofusca]|uniref:TIGR03086 family metal-binding protein n=1 Tax=Kitasatospora purpeofusca TaxID=67352 RepID=UPI0022516B60|nr:TIGR03086 family metal-binding protein [Kitasatospora purpeofusca]MCX4683147.1 TIGR03086 family metal-binding protein [Kitasatospora purpeofusca]